MGNNINKTSSTLQLKSYPKYCDNSVLSVSLAKSGNVTALETLSSLIGNKYNFDILKFFGRDVISPEVILERLYFSCRSK